MLLAQCAADAPVVFTSIHDDTAGGDTNNNGGGTWAKAGDWDGLVFTTTAGGSTLDHVQVFYGGGAGANIQVTGAAVSLTNSLVRDSSAVGLQWLNGASGQISGSEVAASLTNAIALTASSSPAITGNTLRDNRGYALYMEGSCFPAFTGNTLSGNGTNAAGVYGTVGTGAWHPDVTYVAAANLTVESGSTLTVQPGVVVKFLPATNLIVRGSVVAVGAETNRIIFTGLKDDAFGGDTQGDGPATKPAPGDWGTLYFADTSNDATTVLDYVTVRYAGASYNYGAGTATAGIAPDSASPTLDHLVVELSSAYGLQLLNASSPGLRRSTIQDNASHGLWLSASSGPAVSVNSFLRNGGYAVYLGGTSQVVFQGNLADGNLVNGVGVSGTISSNTTWEPDLPYVIADTTTLAINTTVTLQPGVVVKFAAAKKWTVNGSLLAEGTALAPIIFTSLKDDTAGGDTNGNANASYRDRRLGVAQLHADQRRIAPRSYSFPLWRQQQRDRRCGLRRRRTRYGAGSDRDGLEGPRGVRQQRKPVSHWHAPDRQPGGPLQHGIRLQHHPVQRVYGNTLYGVQNVNTAYPLMATENWWGSHTGPTHTRTPAAPATRSPITWTSPGLPRSRPCRCPTHCPRPAHRRPGRR